MSDLINVLLNFSQSLGHLGVFILMTIESTILPVPSELVIPPAAFLAYKGSMNIFLVILLGVLGSMLGATINYFVARLLGRPLVYALAEKNFMKYILVTVHKIHRAEQYFLKYGNISTFLGRLIPGIRHLISLPAGFVKMPFLSFIFFTFAGSAIWVTILAGCGYFLGVNEASIKEYSQIISWIIIIAVLAIFIGVYFWKGKRHNH